MRAATRRETGTGAPLGPMTNPMPRSENAVDAVTFDCRGGLVGRGDRIDATPDVRRVHIRPTVTDVQLLRVMG